MEFLKFGSESAKVEDPKNSKDVVEALVRGKLIPRWDGEIPSFLLSNDALEAFRKFRERDQSSKELVK